MRDLKDKMEDAMVKSKPFVIYKPPDEEEFRAVFQLDSISHYTTDYKQDGFIFAPFDPSNKTLIIPFGSSNRSSFKFDIDIDGVKNKSSEYLNDKSKITHIQLIQKGIDHIKNGKADKIVISRKEMVDAEGMDIYQGLKVLGKTNPKAFVYCWFHPETSLWMGATPETFLKIDENKFETMALASTRAYEGNLNINWNNKEREEHQFVAEYIESKLNAFNLNTSLPYTIRAGNLVHICSVVSGEISSRDQLKFLINTLHPTPAVCGVPKDMAHGFIMKEEHYNREYYTGFLGEILQDNHVNLFVNLRCMKIEDGTAHIFIGGGITKDSHAESEWEETVLKSKLMMGIL